MKNFIVVTSLLLLACCTPKTKTAETIDKPVYIGFTHDKTSDKEGTPIDSATSYFPCNIFTDTIPCYIMPSGEIIEKERQTSVFGSALKELRDTFKIETDSSFFRKTSYMFFKMNEPVLDDQFLDKDIYRITALRSFHRPIVIRIENKDGKITIDSKELNRHISYPFLVVLPSEICFEPPEIKDIQLKVDKEKQLEREKIEIDSLQRLYNNTNYYLTRNDRIEVPHSVWDSLEILVDSAKFWKTKPELFLNHLQVDGSNWYIEGHFKSGYQIKRIPRPHFTPRQYVHKYDKSDYYARIFRFLVESSKFENEDLY